MKCCRNFFGQFKINITIWMRRTSIFHCNMIIIPYFLSSSVTHFLHIQHLLLNWNLLQKFRHDKIFIKIIFYHFFAIIIFFKKCFNKVIDCIFPSVKNDWFAKFIINKYNFVSKTARNMILIFFSIWSIFVSIIYLQSF